MGHKGEGRMCIRAKGEGRRATDPTYLDDEVCTATVGRGAVRRSERVAGLTGCSVCRVDRDPTQPASGRDAVVSGRDPVVSARDARVSDRDAHGVGPRRPCVRPRRPRVGPDAHASGPRRACVGPRRALRRTATRHVVGDRDAPCVDRDAHASDRDAQASDRDTRARTTNHG